MKRLGSYLLLASVAMFCICCTPKGVIPRDDLSKIYAEMFMLDQHLNAQSELRSMVDTVRVYEHIFKKYGYTTEDYIFSMDYYVKNPDRYGKVLKETQSILEKEKSALIAERDKQESAQMEERDYQYARAQRLEGFRRFEPKRFYMLDSLRRDSLGFRSVCFDADSIRRYVMMPDTLFAGPGFVLVEEDVAL